MTATIEPEHARHLFDVEVAGTTAGPWMFVDTQEIRESRWHHVMYLIARDNAGQHWGLTYRIGLTEDQPNELPWENADGPLSLTRLYPHEVVKVEYRTTPPEPEAGQHVIEFREDGWTIQHPLTCRQRGALFDCPVNRVAERTIAKPSPGGLGRWYVELDEAGERLLLGEAATGGASDG